MTSNLGAMSQDDIDSLLESINSSENLSSDNALSSVISATGKKQKIKVYDFKRPDKFSKEQVRTVSSFHETFARYTTTTLSALLRKMVNLHVASVDQLTYEEFIRSIPNSTTLAIINMDPLKGSAIIEVDPTITFAIVDRLFGGDGDTIKDRSNKDLTDIEQSVMESVIIRIIANMREAWSQVVDLRPRFGHIEVNPQFVQIVPPTEMVILVTLEVKIGKIEGLMNFCLPYITIEPIVSKLSTRYWHSLIGVGTNSENLDVLKEKLESTKMSLIADIGEIKLKVKDILSLSKGDVIKLDNSYINKDLVLKVGTKGKFKYRMGLASNKISVQITEKIGEIKDFDLFKELTKESE